MQTEIIFTQPNQVIDQVLSPATSSVCKTPQEKQRLLKLFEIFIEVDKNLKKKHEQSDYKRDTNHAS